jgi:hypothetical protein
VAGDVEDPLRLSKIVYLAAGCSALAALLVTVFFGLMWGCGSGPLKRVVENRTVKIGPRSNSIEFRVSGYMRCPITAEGPFPNWHSSYLAQFSAESLLNLKSSSPEPQIFHYPRDFNFLTFRIKSATIIVNKALNQIDLEIEADESLESTYVSGSYGIMP